MSYARELPANWRPLLAAMLGFGSGYNPWHYTANIFTPFLLQEFHWSRAQFSLVGTVSILTVICAPIAGRLADLLACAAWPAPGSSPRRSSTSPSA